MDTSNPFTWPNGCQAAISFTFDDGLASQREVAIPRLEEHDFCGTFYLNPRGEDWAERLAAWRPAQEAGHEIGNHTIAHPCSLNTGPTLQSWTLERMEADVCEAERRLDQLFPEQGARSFAYPCYESDVGRGPTRTSYVPVIARLFLAARARGASIPPLGRDVDTEHHAQPCGQGDDSEDHRQHPASNPRGEPSTE